MGDECGKFYRATQGNKSTRKGSAKLIGLFMLTRLAKLMFTIPRRKFSENAQGVSAMETKCLVLVYCS